MTQRDLSGIFESSGGVKLRPANDSDLDWIEHELWQFAGFMKTQHTLFNPDREVRRATIKAIMDDHLFIVALNILDSDPIGFCAGVIHEHLLNPDLMVLHEVFWWIKGEYRARTRAPVMLLRSFVEWGKKHVDWIFFSVQHNTPVKPDALLKRGFVEQERMYLMEV